MNLYSDAERVVRRDKSSILRSEKDDAFFERENFFDELLNEILPLHVAFYDRFYCEAKWKFVKINTNARNNKHAKWPFLY